MNKLWSINGFLTAPQLSLAFDVVEYRLQRHVGHMSLRSAVGMGGRNSLQQHLHMTQRRNAGVSSVTVEVTNRTRQHHLRITNTLTVLHFQIPRQKGK